MKAAITITQQELILLVARHLQEKTSGLDIGKVRIMVKSNQNYRAKWEECSIIVLNQEAIDEHNERQRKEDQKWPGLNQIFFVKDALDNFINEAILGDLHRTRLRQISDMCDQPEIKVEVEGL